MVGFDLRPREAIPPRGDRFTDTVPESRETRLGQATLYDAAFAALVQVTPTRGRRAISYLTLFGGFASTVFWPIGYALNASVGWRTTLLASAAVNLLVCMPLHWFGLARRDWEGPAQVAADAGASLPIPRSRARPAPSAWCCSG